MEHKENNGDSMEDTFPIGIRLNWRTISKFRHDWSLIYDNEIIALVKATKRIGNMFEGKYDSFSLLLEYRFKGDKGLISNSISGERIATIDDLMSSSIGRLLFENGKGMFIHHDNTGYRISEEGGDDLARLYYNNMSSPVESSFILLKQPMGIDPRLLAIIGQFYAIQQASGY